ncbi:hypothetical protein, partial [Mesorhizobium marinum]|uniref:hypothetical protein n=1 Tax=Mesorhizobium marinum TaxID=3228790 RepID=UPI003465FF14
KPVLVSFHTYPPGWPFKFWKRRDDQYRSGVALREAMKRDGIRTVMRRRNRPTDADVAVVWGWRQTRMHEPMLSSGRAVVVIERAFIQPRNQWFSLAVNGFNGRGTFPAVQDDGERWEKNFAHHLKPWREVEDGYALVIGQVPGDAALHGRDIVAWAHDVTDELVRLGHKVVYRAHPKGPTPCPPGAVPSTRSLEDDIAGASRVVVYNSTTAVEAVLAGTPTVTMDVGSVAYPVTSHALSDPLVRPDRTGWCHELSWYQWTLA